MQCEEDTIEVPRPCIIELNSVLNELGMLATSTRSRAEYLSEIQNRRYLNLLTLNTRYVSNVSIGFTLRPVPPRVRYKPYTAPKERHRTRSENNDNEVTNCGKDVVDECLESALEVNQLKKSKSLESIIAENSQGAEGLGNSSELEVVSKSIQNLRVNE